MPPKPDRFSTATCCILIGLGIAAAALAFLSSAKGEDAWLAAGYVLFAAVLALASFAGIWIQRVKAHRPLRALRDTCVLVAVLGVATILGHRIRYRDLTPTMERIEILAAAIIEHQLIHQALPVSITEIEAALPRPAQQLYAISYKPRGNGSFTLAFCPSWYRHEYFPATRSWVVSD